MVGRARLPNGPRKLGPHVPQAHGQLRVVPDMLEEESIYWVDDLDLAASMAIKTIKTIKEGDEDVDILPLWRDDDDDKAFMEDCFTKTLGRRGQRSHDSRGRPKLGTGAHRHHRQDFDEDGVGGSPNV